MFRSHAVRSTALLALAACDRTAEISTMASAKLTIDGHVLVESGTLTEVPVGTPHTFHFVVTPTGGSLPAGTTLEVVVPATFDQPQTGDGTVPGYTVAGRFDAESWYVRGEESAPADASAAAEAGGEEEVDVEIYLEDQDGADGEDEELTGTEPWVASIVLAETLTASDVLEVVYGETAEGGLGARTSYLARDNFQFEVRLDTDGDGTHATVATYQVSATPGPAAALRVYPASGAPLGSAAPVRVAVFDAWGNATTGAEDGLACRWRRNDAETDDVAVSHGGPGSEGASVALATPTTSGPWRLSCTHPTLPVFVEGATIVAESGEAGGEAGEGAAPPSHLGNQRFLLWGDFHIHSTVSGDATAYSQTPANCYAYARTTAGLDIASVSDHDRSGITSQTNFETQEIAATNDAYAPGAFVTLLSWEWTDTNPAATDAEGGHKIVYYQQGDGSYYCESATDPDPRCAGGAVPQMYSNTSTTSDTACELWTLLAAQQANTTPQVTGITFPHHVATQGTPSRTAWTTVPTDCGGSPAPAASIQPISEVYSEHGSNEGWNGTAPSTIEDPVVCSADPTRTVQEAQEYRWSATANKPHFLGVIGASDNHTGRPGQDPLPRTDTTSTGMLGVGTKCALSTQFRWREAGLAAVWVSATDATAARDRARVFESLRGRRTYATSGSRITLTYFLRDLAGAVETLVDQGGFLLTGPPNLDDPEYDLVGAAGHTTSLELEAICPGTGDAPLESVSVIRGVGTPGSAGSWTWSTVASFNSFDSATGCLLAGSVPLVTGGAPNSATLATGKNVYYVKVKEANLLPVRITDDKNLLRVGTSLSNVVGCTLTTGTWLPASYAAQLQADLNAASCGGAMNRTFTVTYDNVANGTYSTDFRFRIQANQRFAMDLATAGAYPEVEATAAILGYAAVDKTGFSAYTGDDQVQYYENAEFAWSSPIWLDYQP